MAALRAARRGDFLRCARLFLERREAPAGAEGATK
jgi:hypothetical protein